MDYSLIVKMTNDCNLNCSYCYHRRDANRNFSLSMSRDTLDSMIFHLLQHNEEHAEFIWHGGEPLLVGLDTFRFILEKQKEYNTKGLEIRNAVQTNATLLNEEYIRFFIQNDIHVGISIDGPFDMHAAERGTQDTEYMRILSAVKELNRNEARFGALCVVGKQHVGQARRIFELFYEHNIRHLAFLPCLVQENGIVDQKLTISPREYGQFLIDFFEVWIHGEMRGLCVRNFDDCIRFFRNRPTKTCIHANTCDRYLTVMPDGKVFLCDNFASNEEHQVGHVKEGFSSVDTTEAMGWLKEAMLIIPDSCSRCKYYCGCNSGCKYRRWVRDPSMQQGHYYCQSTQMLFRHVQKALGMKEK